MCKNILVIGGAGFIGSNLVDKLVEKDNVYVLDDLSTGKKEYVNEKATFILRDISKIEDNIKKDLFILPEKIDTIYHLGAESRIQPSLKNPLNTVDVNVKGTAIVCNIAKEYNSKIIYAGSCTAYEKDYLSPYSLTKVQGEQICKMYNKLYNVPVNIARFFNVYGPRQMEEGNHSTVVGIFKKQYENNEPLTITGTGEQERDFIHVYDIVDGLIKIDEKGKDGEIYNLGVGRCTSIKKLASYFKCKIKYIDKREGEMEWALSDLTSSIRDLEFKAKHDIQDYINEIKNG